MAGVSYRFVSRGACGRDKPLQRQCIGWVGSGMLLDAGETLVVSDFVYCQAGGARTSSEKPYRERWCSMLCVVGGTLGGMGLLWDSV